MDKQIFENYAQQILRYPLLDKDKEQELAKKIQNGDQKALMTLIESNLRLVVCVAKHYSSARTPIMDLIQEGNIGLMTAASKFSSSFKTRFSTYAYAWIQQAILRYIRHKLPVIAIPHRKEESLRNIRQAKFHLSQKLLREPSTSELAVYLGVSDTTITDLLKFDYTVNLFEMTTDEGIEVSACDYIQDFTYAPEEIVVENEEIQSIREMLKQLPEFEYKVMYYRYNIGSEKNCWTFRQIGELLGVSAETVRQTEMRAMRKLRLAIKEGKVLSM